MGFIYVGEKKKVNSSIIINICSSNKQHEPITIQQLVVIPEVKTIQQLADNQLISVRKARLKAATKEIRTSTLVFCIT